MKHLNEVNMTYFQHFRRANRLTWYFLKGAVLTFIHSIYPNFFPLAATHTHTLVDAELKSHPNDKSE